MRVFLGIEVPEDLRAKLAHVNEVLSREGLMNGNFVHKDNLHITLKFLGEGITSEDLEKLKKILYDVKDDFVKVKIGDYGFFPNENNIKVFWCSLLSDELNGFQKKLDEILSKNGFNVKEDKEFHPHLTLCRVKGVKDKARLNDKLKSLGLHNSGFETGEFSLFKSELTRNGPNYKKIESFVFKK